MRFVGNKVESDAKRHKDHRYTHTDERGVNYYDCFAHDDEARPAFGEELNKGRVYEIEKAIEAINKINNQYEE